MLPSSRAHFLQKYRVYLRDEPLEVVTLAFTPLNAFLTLEVSRDLRIFLLSLPLKHSPADTSMASNVKTSPL